MYKSPAEPWDTEWFTVTDFPQGDIFNQNFLTGRMTLSPSTYLTVAFTSDSVMHTNPDRFQDKQQGDLQQRKTVKWKMMFAEGTCENIPFRLITTKRLSSLNRSPKTPSGYHVNQMWLRAPCAFHQCKCHARPCKLSFLGRVSDLLSVVFS